MAAAFMLANFAAARARSVGVRSRRWKFTAKACSRGSGPSLALLPKSRYRGLDLARIQSELATAAVNDLAAMQDNLVP